MRKSRILATIVLALIVAGASWLLYERTRTPEIRYRNTTYGVSVRLPSAWQGYTVQERVWTAYDISSPDSNQRQIAQGPELHIIHPLSTASAPRQDIPIMVFTLAQWAHLQKEEWSVGAAPVPPTELARTATYVFALPARYNYAFPTGFEEVEQIIRNGAVAAQ